MQALRSAWHGSPHRNVRLHDCHDAERSSHQAAPRPGRTSSATCRERSGSASRMCSTMMPNCQSCHQQEYAAWQAGPHSATYGRIFLDTKHNTTTLLDGRLPALPRHALRGRHPRPGSARRTRNGPWHLKPADLANRARHALSGVSPDASRRAACKPSREARISVAGQPVHDFAGLLRSPREHALRRRRPRHSRTARWRPRRSR